ncbi:MAG: winged helix-turn-helix domain-containing protein [Candidatus Thorarchaeota archaeon]|nr:winged helix-turn-helix domain-containing protein [Candidatus Thorarchaeota archaeon]
MVLEVSQDDNLARMNLRLAGVLQEIQNAWTRRLDSYFVELERLISGEWLDSSDLAALVREARSASREAMEGMSNDLASELMHASTGLLQRHNAEKSSLSEEIFDLRSQLGRLMERDENLVFMENESLREALHALPEFQILEILRRHTGCSYKELAAVTGWKSSVVRKNVTLLTSKGYVRIDKDTKPHSIHFISAPWNSDFGPSIQTRLPAIQPNQH